MSGRGARQGNQEVAAMAERIRVAPEICSSVDDEHTKLTIEVSIPGVKREDVNLRMHEDSMALSAPRDDVEFTTTLAFCCPVRASEAVAKYENGLLRIEVPFKDVMDDAIRVEIT
jgi:HSP20 family molecular chaperone IbpA